MSAFVRCNCGPCQVCLRNDLESIDDNDGFVEAVFSDGRKESIDFIAGANSQGLRRVAGRRQYQGTRPC
jgi:hypothetical protein